ncbi:MAG: DUF1015 domain-containing protein [Gemmatimonadota bacterium]|nr:MAG: DUF1015 domain-containing protein [Gemmatimonadota bacterium]
MTVRVASFRALRYRADRVGDLGAVWAPPYDVINAELAAELRERSPYNIVRITNPGGRDAERYGEAARTLGAWVDDGVLAREDHPAFYVHRHSFGFGGKVLKRTGIWSLLKLASFEEAVVLPHEGTMKGPKADRLALMSACRAQLSPIFFISSDPEGQVSKLLRGVARKRPAERAEFPTGEGHEIWRVEKRQVQEQLSEALQDQVFLIADGHHRYETALAYRDELAAGGAPAGGRGAHEYVLAYIVPESDPGLLLLPTHRTIGGEPVNWIGAALNAAADFEIVRLADSDLDSAQRMLEEEAGRPTFVLVARNGPGGWLMRLRDANTQSAVSSVALHDSFLSGCLDLTWEEQLERISYVKEAGEALRAVRSGSAQAAALLAAPRVAQVREAAALGERMPPKTTFFWPKVPTGVAIRVVDAGEEVGDQ